MIYQGKARYPVDTAVIHCAAIPTGWAIGKTPFQVFAEINRWHRERGFVNGFGYHGLIMPDGSTYPGRPYSMIGAHVIEANRGTLGFLLIESRKVERIGEFDDWFNPPQRRALLNLLAQIPGLRNVRGHNDYAPRLCPGFKVDPADWLALPSRVPVGDNFTWAKGN
jgi:hypothetical protein